MIAKSKGLDRPVVREPGGWADTHRREEQLGEAGAYRYRILAAIANYL